MKHTKRIISVLIVLTIALTVFSSCSSSKTILVPNSENVIVPNSAGNDVKKEGYELVKETNTLQLFINKDTTHFKVVNKVDNQTYSSKPLSPNVDVENSLFDISYVDDKGVIQAMNSYNDSVSKGQYKIENIDNGFKVNFTLGNVQEKLYCPVAFTEARFKEVLAKVSDNYEKQVLKGYYYLVNYEKIIDADKKADVVAKVPAARNELMYTLKEDNVAVTVQRKINDVLVKAGYTEKDYEEDSKNSPNSLSSKEAAFNINLYVTLENEALKVRMPISEIVEFNGGNITFVNMLRTFASPEKDQKGYFITPDGSGSKMNFYNGKGEMQDLQTSVFGADDSVEQFETPYVLQQAYLPICITKFEGGGAVLAEVVDSQATTDIRTNPGTDITYATQYPSFKVREMIKSYLNAAKNPSDFFYVTQKKLYDKDLAVEYKFFGKDKAEIFDVAEYYQNKVFKSDQKASDVPPVYVDFIGVAKEKDTFMGAVTYNPALFSTLKEVKEKGQELVDAGATNLVFRLTGFLNDGIDASLFTKAKLNKQVGTDKDLANLMSWGKANNIPIYLDADIQYNSKYGMFDGFSDTKDVSYNLTRLTSMKQETALSTGSNFSMAQMETKVRNVLTPVSITKTANNVSTLFNDLGVTNYSLSNIGEQLNSDYKNGRETTRQQAANSLAKDIEKIAGSGKILMNGANSYALPYATDIVNVPLESLQYENTQGYYPILQMVLDSKVNFAGPAVNLNADTRRDALTTLRSGAGFHFVVTTNKTKEFSKTTHPELYSTKFDFWKDNIVAKAKMLQETASVTSKGIKAFEKLANDVYITTYKDNSYMVTNYTEKEFGYNGKTVKPLDYTLGKVGN